MPVTSAQVRMARAALNWTVRELAAATGLHRNTIINIEVGRYGGSEESQALIEVAFRKAGVVFLPQDAVRLLKPKATKAAASNIVDGSIETVTGISYDMRHSIPVLNPLSSGQIRAGRALLRWSAEELARASAVGITTIRRAELTEHRTSLTAANDLAIRHALEAAGIELIDENGGGPGVRLREPTPGKKPGVKVSPPR